MPQIYANVNTEFLPANNVFYYLPFVEGVAGTSPTYLRSLAMPFGGTLSLDIVANFFLDPGTFSIALRRNQVATDLDTDAVTPGSAGPATLSLSASGWTKGDLLHLHARTTQNRPNVNLFFTIDAT